MKKTLIALAAIAAVSAAQADVTLYGVIDMGIQTTSAGQSSDLNNPSNSNFYPTKYLSVTAGRQTGFNNGTLTPSRWGIKGSENLGDGLKANFVLESRFNQGLNPNDHALLATNSSTSIYGAGDSSINGGLFDSQATVGLSGGFGTIDFGYQLNVLGSAYGDNDPLIGGYVSPLGTYGGLTGMGSSYTGRASNSIKYKSSMGNTTIGAFYAMGGAAGNAGAGSQYGLSVALAATPTLNVTVVGQRMNDNVSFNSYNSTSGASYVASSSAYGAVTPGTIPVSGLTASYFNSTSASLMGNWQATPTLKMFAGYTSIVQSNPSNGAYDATLTQNQGIAIGGTAYSGYNINPYATNYTTTVSWLGGVYDLSTTDRVRFGYYSVTKGAYTANVSSTYTQAYASSQQGSFVALYDKDLSKQTDVYTYATLVQTANSGISAAANDSGVSAVNNFGALRGTSVSQFGAGLRMKF